MAAHDPRPFVTAYQPGTKRWLWIAYNANGMMNKDADKSCMPLEEWIHPHYPGRTWTAYRVVYSQKMARAWITKVGQAAVEGKPLDIMDGPDLVIVVDKQTNKTLLTVWHVLHLGNALEIKSDTRARLLEPEALLIKELTSEGLLPQLRTELLSMLGNTECPLADVPGGVTAAWVVTTLADMPWYL